MQILGKNSQVHFIITRKWSNPPLPLGILDNFPPWCILFPSTIRQKRVFYCYTSTRIRSNDFRFKRFVFFGYFASTSHKVKRFKKLFEFATSNLSVLDKILVCILPGFNFPNKHFPKYSRKAQKIAKSQNFIHAKFYPRKIHYIQPQDLENSYREQRQNYLFLGVFQKMTVCRCKLCVKIFQEACLFFYSLCDCDTSKPMNSNWTENWKGCFWVR